MKKGECKKDKSFVTGKGPDRHRIGIWECRTPGVREICVTVSTSLHKRAPDLQSVFSTTNFTTQLDPVVIHDFGLMSIFTGT